MTSSLGRVIARLAEPAEELPPELVNLINKNIKPPTTVTAGEVYVRAMYIVSDQVNSFGGRFPGDEHTRLAELLVDSPVLIGHRKDKLPVGRNFHAVTLERDGRPWVKSYFYWLRAADTSEQLRENIDGGIYKECSVAFTFGLPECSICGRDIRQCEHEPFEVYEQNGVKEVCHFNYRRIERVLETSLVYRGAIPETTVSKDLGSAKGSDRTKPNSDHTCEPVRIDNLDSLDHDEKYLVVPRYDGLPLTARVCDGVLSMARPDGSPVGSHFPEACLPISFRPREPVYGVLVGYRGRERCTRRQLEQYLADRSGPVSRLALNIYPNQGLPTLPRVVVKSLLDVCMIPHRITTAAELDRRAREIMTRDGVEIWPLVNLGNYVDPDGPIRFSYRPPEPVRLSKPGYTITIRPDSDVATFTFAVAEAGIDSADSGEQAFDVIGFDLSRLRQGRRFVARRVSSRRLRKVGSERTIVRGRVTALESRDGCLGLDNDGELSGRLMLRPIRLNGRDDYLFYAVASRSKAEQAAK